MNFVKTIAATVALIASTSAFAAPGDMNAQYGVYQGHGRNEISRARTHSNEKRAHFRKNGIYLSVRKLSNCSLRLLA